MPSGRGLPTRKTAAPGGGGGGGGGSRKSASTSSVGTKSGGGSRRRTRGLPLSGGKGTGSSPSPSSPTASASNNTSSRRVARRPSVTGIAVAATATAVASTKTKSRRTRGLPLSKGSGSGGSGSSSSPPPSGSAANNTGLGKETSTKTGIAVATNATTKTKSRRTRGLPLSGGNKGGGSPSPSPSANNNTGSGRTVVRSSSISSSTTTTTGITAAAATSSSKKRKKTSSTTTSTTTTTSTNKKINTSNSSSNGSGNGSRRVVKKESSSTSAMASPPPHYQQQQQQQSQSQLLQAVFNKSDGEKFNHTRRNNGPTSSSLEWNIKIIVNGKQYNPKHNSTQISSSRRQQQQQQQQPKLQRPRRWRLYSKDDEKTEDAAEMLGTIDSNDDSNDSDDHSDSDDSDTPVADIASSSSTGSMAAATTAAATTTTTTQSQSQQQQPRIPSFTKRIVGNDGNFHYCKKCGETGEVVCCDGCPQVYHPQCLPEDSESFAALDVQEDDDPWYCPGCVDIKKRQGKKKKTESSSSTAAAMKGSSSSSNNRKIKSSNTRKNKKSSSKTTTTTTTKGGGREEGGGEEQEDNVSPYRQQRPKRKCSYDNDDAIDDEDDDDDEMLVDEDGDVVAIAVAINDDDDGNMEDIEEAIIADTVPSMSSPTNTKRSYSPTKASPTSTSFTSPSSRSGISSGGGGVLSSMKKRSKKRQKTGSSSSSSNRPTSPVRSSSPKPSTPKSVQSGRKKEKKKKKKKKKHHLNDGDSPASSGRGRDGGEGSGGSANQDDSNIHNDDNDDDDDNDDGGMLASLLRANSAGGVVKAVPAFYFFLNENRGKIDRSLSRKHKYFNRLPKANMERNQLIAKEGISMWSKLPDVEVKRHVEISMKDFERRIIEWKEEKNLRNMTSNSADGDHHSGGTRYSRGLDGDSTPQDLLLEDDRITFENHSRLYLATTVGYKPYRPDLEESNNRILLELLQDMRFHPLPLLKANREAREYGEMDYDRVTIPYFDVNGPVSTCLGDECLGCSRGWTHFCNVLKRRMPAVARRAKLQPPLSSLVATRVGLGITSRRPGETDDEEGNEEHENNDDDSNDDEDDDDEEEDNHKNKHGTNKNGTTTTTSSKGEKNSEHKNGTTTTSTTASKAPKAAKASSVNKKKVALVAAAAAAAAAAKKSTSSTDVDTFTSRDIPAAVEAKKLPQYPWDSLTLPSERADDIVRFVEEAISMKIPEPPRPAGEYDTSDGDIEMGISDLLPISSTIVTTTAGAAANTTITATNTSAIQSTKLNVPLRGRKRRIDEYGLVTEEEEEEEIIVNKCGRCRTIIDGDTGCVPCRRAQLVINLSRGDVPGEDSKLLRVQTGMLGRILLRDVDVDAQVDGDKAIANHILRERWTPFAILPPQTLTAPSPILTEEKSSSSSSSNSSVADEHETEEDIDQEDNGSDNGINDKLKQPTSVDHKDTTKASILDAADISGGGSGSINAVLGDTEMVVDAAESATTGVSSHRDADGAAAAAETLQGPTSSKHVRIRASSRIVALESNTNTASSTTLAGERDEDDRNIIGKKFKDETNAVHRKCVSIASLGILLALMRRDPLLLFAEPAEVVCKGYNKFIKKPMDFSTIKRKVLQNKYPTLGSFVSDAKVLCDNAMIYNPLDSIYWRTAKELSDALSIMKEKAGTWISVIKDAHASSFQCIFNKKLEVIEEEEEDNKKKKRKTISYLAGDPFHDLRKEWPEAMEMFEDNDWLRTAVETDFMRTKENEPAYYGSLAIRRAAMAAAVSLAPYTDTSGIFKTVGRRTHEDDENLRKFINAKVVESVHPPELKEIPSWREEMIMRVLRKSQARRMDGRIVSMHGCARCDGVQVQLDPESNKTMTAATVRWGRTRKKPNEVPRVHKSRRTLTTGLGSHKMKERIKQHKKSDMRKGLVKGKIAALVSAADNINEVAVTARGSRIHGMGLFADQPLQKGDVVAEYVGEYVTPAVTDARDRTYQKERIQDYQFRIDSQIVIDATKRGGHGRYANHNCDPNCATKIIPFSMADVTAAASTGDGEGDGHGYYGDDDGCDRNSSFRRRVVIVAQRDIDATEELTYDYQFPLEIDLEERIPCNCNARNCRGFMNWDLPEKGANTSAFRGGSQKRGANMRDRIRRLGRPLKGDR